MIISLSIVEQNLAGNDAVVSAVMLSSHHTGIHIMCRRAHHVKKYT